VKEKRRDPYLDALRAGALLLVVFGHWLATLPRLQDGLMVSTEHLLKVWPAAGLLTWVAQVVPLFVFVSAAASTDGMARRLRRDLPLLPWWGGRALGLARPTVTYLAALAAFALASLFTGGRLLEPLNHSLTIHLWFLLMLLMVQALLPLSVRADQRYGMGAVAGLLVMAFAVDLLRAGPASARGLLELGALVTASPGGVGWINGLVVWLLPQQLGIAWQQGRFRGPWMGGAFMLLGLGWLAGAVASGYPTGMIGIDLDGNSNMLPPTLGLIGVMWLQIGAVLLLEKPARRLLRLGQVGGAVSLLGALSMPLYLWHKLAELPAAWLGERLGLPIDAGVPGESGFWMGRFWWVALCLLMVVPVLAAVVRYEARRRHKLAPAAFTPLVLAGGLALFAGLGVSLTLGAMPGAVIGVVAVLAASRLLRAQKTRHLGR
jgi:peptidoglycan/LPS O-acetylase OafA/YrhL